MSKLSQYFQISVLSLLVVLTSITSGCAVIGQEFPVADVPNIEIGVSTKKDIQTMFGSPWRTGLESGQKTWTYGLYSYGLFKDKLATDLVVRFDAQGKVASYTFSTTEHKE